MHDNLILQDRYQMKKLLGEGICPTYLAENIHSKKPCVIKCLSMKSLTEKRQIDLFEREVKILSNLHHPQIPFLIDYFKIESDKDIRLYFVQEYIKGENLAELTAQGRKFSEKEVIETALSLCGVLEYLHTFSPPVIHRDIKPSNIMIGKDQKVYLIDFGAVRDTMMHIDKTDPTIVGTYGYMPMEQFGGQVVPASDIYSLGVTMIHMLSLKEPADLKQINHTLDFSHYVKISAGFTQLLEKMIEPDLEKRYNDITSVTSDLKKLLSGKYRVKIHPKYLYSGFAVVCSALIGIFYFLRPEENSLHSGLTSSGGRIASIVNGRLLYDGKPITDFTNADPELWVRNGVTVGDNRKHDKKKNAELIVKSGGDNSAFEIYSNESGADVTGNYVVYAEIDANQNNGHERPGDFTAAEDFQLTQGHNPDLIINMKKIIRLISPQNNDTFQELKIFPRPITITWEPLGDNVVYHYAVKRSNLDNKSLVSSTTDKTEVTLSLPPNDVNNHYYRFSLTAKKEGREIGILLTHQGFGYDYGFIIK